MSDADTPEERARSAPTEPDAAAESDDQLEPVERPLFLHPQWMVGIVLIFAVMAIIAGLDNPLWLLIGSPFILVLLIYVWVRFMPRD